MRTRQLSCSHPDIQVTLMYLNYQFYKAMLIQSLWLCPSVYGLAINEPPLTMTTVSIPVRELKYPSRVA